MSVVCGGKLYGISGQQVSVKGKSKKENHFGHWFSGQGAWDASIVLNPQEGLVESNMVSGYTKRTKCKR